MHKHLGKFDNSVEIPHSTFLEAVRELIESCESNAYIFINQPGLRKNDLVEFEEEFVNLENYLSRSSTSVGFEQVELLPDDTFDQLTEFMQEHCRIDHVLYVEGDNLDSFQPYIDIEKRIIRIEYPPLPEDEELRRQAIFEFDSNLRKFLAQVPSPAHSIIYTSLDPGMDVPDSKESIFPQIFRDKNRELPIERNNHHLNIPPIFNEYKPKYSGMTGNYLSIFDTEFIKENKQLLLAIVTSLFGFLILQLVPTGSVPAAPTKTKEPTKENRTINQRPIVAPKINVNAPGEYSGSD